MPGGHFCRVFSSVVPAPHRFFTGPREVAETLSSTASLLLDIVWLNAPDVSLPADQSIIDELFRCFRCVEPYPQRSVLAQRFVLAFKPYNAINLVAFWPRGCSLPRFC